MPLELRLLRAVKTDAAAALIPGFAVLHTPEEDRASYRRVFAAGPIWGASTATG